jgi:hypothetical protein
MRKTIRIIFAFFSVLFITALIVDPAINKSILKATLVDKPISAEVLKIAERSCKVCHMVPGNKRALSRLNLTNWDKYAPEKQAAKAQAISDIISVNKMPPPKYMQKHPGIVLSKDDVNTIINWAQ